MKVAILGYGKQGESAYTYWRELGDKVTICDSRTDIKTPDGALTTLGNTYLEDLGEYDLLVRAAPTIHPREIVAANPNNPDILDKVTTNTNEFFRVCPTKNIIGVTGTKGKGTTSTLIAKMLEADGKRVHLGGNIGTPPLELLANNIAPTDWVVLELANFQLIDLRYSPHIGVCVMVVPEHLDWHEDFEEYVAAKQQLFINQTEEDVAIYYAKNETSESIAAATEGTLIPYMEKPGAYVKDAFVIIDSKNLCRTDEIALLGEHNWQNICAAVTATWQVTKNIEALRDTVKNFHGLPFRIEFRKEVSGIRYYNDSFASAVGATVAAMKSIKEPKVMIIGGFERGLPLEELGTELRNIGAGIRKVLLIGQTAQRVADTLDKAKYNNYVISEAKDMGSIVQQATELAQDGDAVVLSPAFASFDMFKNFEDRGIKFNEAVDRL